MTFAFGLGLGTLNSRAQWLEVYYPKPLLKPSEALITALKKATGANNFEQPLRLDPKTLKALTDHLRSQEPDIAELAQTYLSSQAPVVATLLDQDSALTSTPAAYLKLHLLSHRLVKPQQLNLQGLFQALPNIAWTNQGAIDLTELPQRQQQARLTGQQLTVFSVDKFPKLTDYLVPSGVRIADTARVRLGAYLGEGTTLMHEGFVNFNAGTQGPSMVEGRISAGVFVAARSDLGGGCSIMGTLSGGGELVIAIGKDCLIGANAGTGISLGDRCTLEAGLYITAASKIQQLDNRGNIIGTVKGRELSGHSDLLFRRNSLTGSIQALPKANTTTLNSQLHQND